MGCLLLAEGEQQQAQKKAVRQIAKALMTAQANYYQDGVPQGTIITPFLEVIVVL